jgi:hypothetical protein
MKIFLFTLVSAASLVMIDPARPQYVPYQASPGYTMAPASPQYGPGLGQSAPGYQWRDERAQGDWRNNTWREQRTNEDWRSNNWRTQRANEDWRERENSAKDRTKNNATDRGYVECGVGAVGSSMPCRDYAKEKPKTKPVDRAYVECGPNSVAESCRPRVDDRDEPTPPKPAHPPTPSTETKQ